MHGSSFGANSSFQRAVVVLTRDIFVSICGLIVVYLEFEFRNLDIGKFQVTKYTKHTPNPYHSILDDFSGSLIISSSRCILRFVHLFTKEIQSRDSSKD